MIQLLLLALLVSPQDAESAPTSKLTGAALPEGAFRLLDKDTVEKTTPILKALYPNVELGRVEVLLWAGDYSGDKWAALRQKTGKALEKEGFAWKETLSEEKIEGRELFLATATKENRRVRGVWMGTAEAAMLVWSEEPDKSGALFENVIYTAPKGWTVQVAADSVTMTPSDLHPDEKLFVLVLQGRAYTGNLAEDAGTLWAEVCKTFDVTGSLSNESISVRRSFKGWSYFKHAGTVKKDTKDLYLIVYFLRVGDRLERVAVLTNWVNQPYRETPAHNPKYHPAILDFVFSLKFKNHTEPSLSAPLLTGDGIVGVWEGMKMGFTASSGKLDYKPSIVAFYGNGLAFYNDRLPTNAFERMNPYVQGEETPRWWGTWTFENGRGVLKLPYGEIPLEAKGLDLVLTTMKTPHTYFRKASVDGARFDGTWAFEPNEGKTREITFTPDGKFTDEGALKVVEHNLYRLYGIAAAPGAGTYEVKNFTVLFHYADGREFSVAFLGPKGDPRAATLTLGFNHDVLKRK